MKNLKIIASILLLSATVAFASCGSDPDNNAKSTHVDSTNVNGTAPVQYGADNPADTSARYDESDDTGRRANTNER